MTRNEKLVTAVIVICLLIGYVIVGSHFEPVTRIQTISGAK